MKARKNTIWHYGFIFFEDAYDMDLFISESNPNKIFFAGEIEDLTYKKAAKVAQIHPNFEKYCEFAMMPLFQGKGKTKSGTECPIMALESYKTKLEYEKGMSYILIWKIM
jgi:hypothetical protein